MSIQPDWRCCQKCQVLFYDGYPDKGRCEAGGGHQAQLVPLPPFASPLNFMLSYDVPETPTAQIAWRYCMNCHAMFFDGYPDKGACPAGGGHKALGHVFVLPYDVPETPTAQAAWRYCTKCHAMFLTEIGRKVFARAIPCLPLCEADLCGMAATNRRSRATCSSCRTIYRRHHHRRRNGSAWTRPVLPSAREPPSVDTVALQSTVTVLHTSRDTFMTVDSLPMIVWWSSPSRTRMDMHMRRPIAAQYMEPTRPEAEISIGTIGEPTTSSDRIGTK
jgi:hypothetical protein